MEPDSQTVIPENIRRLYPFRTRTASVDGERMSYVDEGATDAPALLLLHGNPTWSFLYRNSIEVLRSRFRVIAPDHVGFGLSNKPRQAGYHTLRRHIANLAALIAELKLEKFSLVVHDLGGPIGLGYSVANPTAIERLIILNTWLTPPPAHGELALPWQLRLLRGPLGPWMLRDLNVMISPGIQNGTRRRLSRDVVDAYRLPFADAASRNALVEVPRMIPTRASGENAAAMEEIAAGMKNITASASILWGADDPVLRGKMMPYLIRDTLPNCAEPTFLKASHFVPEDAPEAINEMLLKRFTPPETKPQPLFKILR